MKKILLTLLYPFWFFFSKTFLGGVLMVCNLPVLVALVVSIFLPKTVDLNNIAGGLSVFGILASMLLIIPLTALGDYLENHYEKWNYKTEIKYKM